MRPPGIAPVVQQPADRFARAREFPRREPAVVFWAVERQVPEEAAQAAVVAQAADAAMAVVAAAF